MLKQAVQKLELLNHVVACLTVVETLFGPV